MIDNSETLVLRVSLNDVEPEVWRVIEVAGFGTLGMLHGALVGAMGWDDSHLHSFMVEITVAESLPEVGSSIMWLYDWGDGWEHTITVEDKGTMQHDVTYPVLYDGARACPPEDCGGAYIYMEILHMLDDPSYRPEVVDRDEIMNWLDPDFDPDVFHSKLARWHMRNPVPKKPW